MNKTTNIVIGALAIIALIVGVVSYSKVPAQIMGAAGQQGEQGIQGPVGPAGRDGRNGVDGVTKVVTQVVQAPVQQVPQQQVYGSVTGPDFYGPYQGVNNSRLWTVRQPMNSATTTICAMKAPSATSTLQYAGWQITTGTSTAATIDIGSSTTAYATTTVKRSQTIVASGAQGYDYWFSAGAGVDDSVMAPNTYIVVKTGAGLSGYTYIGTCTALFREF
jgi:hypothetical protein